MRRLDERSMFLVDGAGALVSALMTGLVLPLFERWTRIPPSISTGLAIPPLFLAAFSFTCNRWKGAIRSWMLWTLVSANLAYCAVALGLVFLHDDVSAWGRAWIAAEAVVIVGLVTLEARIARRL